MSSNSPPGAASLASHRTEGRRFAPARWALRAVLWLLFATWAVLLVGWLSLHWLILPHIEEWRGTVEAHASRVLGATVKIGAISAQSSGWVPSLELSDVRVLDAEQRVALTLPRVFAALSPRSVIALEPRFAQLLIEGARLDIRRDKSGRIRVAGLDVAGSGVPDDDAAADWFFHQSEFVIRSGTLRWIDEMRDAPPLVLADVDLVVRNGLRDHDLRLDATPPEGWGERFSVRGRFTQALFDKSGDWRRWSGRVYADLPRADLSELKRRMTLPFELSEGDGALRGWFDVDHGQPTRASVELALRAVALRLDAHVEPLEFEQVSGRIDAEKKDDRITVAAQRLAFRTGDGLSWPESAMTVAWRQSEAGDVTSGDLDADRLDVGVMAAIASRVPLGSALRELLADVRPRGVITGLRTHWDGPIDAPTHYRVKGLLSDLSLAARPSSQAADAIGRPGVQNASLQLDASDTGGQAQITVRAGRIDLPGVLKEPQLALDRLDAHLTWKVDEPASAAPTVTVKVGPASFANADAKGDLSATWRTGRGNGVGRGGRYPGELELDGHVTDAAAVRIGRYLPLGLPEGVRSYIGRAVQAGTIRSASFRVRGDLSDFPFHDPKVARDAEFRVVAKVDGLTFAYAPGDASPSAAAAPRAEVWPPLTAASGEIVVDRTTLDLRDVKGRLLGVEWSGLQGRIAEMGSNGRLDLEGTGRGALAEMLRFVATTPVARWTGQALSAATATGPAELKLALAVPLAHVAETTVKGTLALAGNDLRMTPDSPLLGAARARIDFSQKGFTVNGGGARVLGGELAFEGGSSAGLAGGDTQRFNGRGTFSAEALRQATELGTVARFAGFATGQSTYRASLSFVGGRPHVSVASNLVGMAIDLPPPFAKAAPAALALRIRTAPVAVAAGAPAESTSRDALQVDYGGLVQAEFVRESSGDTSRVVRGAIRVVDTRAAGSERTAIEPTPLDPIEPLPMPVSGVAASVAVNKLDVDVWQGVLARFQGEPSSARLATTVPAATTAGTTAPLVFDSSGGAGYVPTTIALRVGELAFGSRRLAKVTAGLSQQGDLWRANVDADELAGYVEYRPARRGAAGAGRVYSRLSRLSLPKGEAERVESLLEEQPASIPALDIVVDDFELRGKRLGRLEIEAINRVAAGREAAREWQLSKLNLTMPEAHFVATGTWGAAAGAPPGARRAAIDFTLALSDSGALLERLGMGRVIKGGKGSLTGEVAWPGSPFSPDYAKMTGQVKVAIDSGQFLKVSPGAARLLSVLSLQSLPRRLLFDFRDLFAEGFAFDNVVGDVRIGQGLASTNNLRMRGAAAAVLMEGSADLEHETENLRVVVVPEINAGTASLAFAVINPAIGLGTFLAQYFLRKPLMAASTREFRVTGPWDDPKVDRVERSLLGEALPADASAAGADRPAEVTR